MKYGYDFPRSAQIELTSECNLNCVHCYNYWRSSDEILPVFPEQKISEFVDILAENGIFYLAITGGEPLLHPGLGFLLERASSAGISCWVNSNLAALDYEIASTLIENKTTIRTSVLSFESSTHDRIACMTGAFERTIAGIQLLKSDLPIHVNMVVMQSNQNQVFQTGLFLKSLGIKNFTATKISPVLVNSNYDQMKLSSESVVRMLDDLLELRDKHDMCTSTLTVIPACLVTAPEKYQGLLLSQPCIAGKTECAISADGSVKPCVRDDVSYGNIFEEKLSDIWERWGAWEDGALIPEQCNNCSHLARCGGGCRIDCKCCSSIDSLDDYAINPGSFPIST